MKQRKSVSLMTALLLLLTLVPLFGLGAFAENGSVTDVGTYHVSMEAGGTDEICFTPSEGGFYMFRSDADGDIAPVMVLDFGMNALPAYTRHQDQNVCICFQLEAGEPCTLRVSEANGRAAEFDVIISYESRNNPASDQSTDRTGEYCLMTQYYYPAKLYFTPSESGSYCFAAVPGNEYPAHAILYDKNGDYLTDSEVRSDFSLCAELKAEERYCLQLGTYYSYFTDIGVYISPAGGELNLDAEASVLSEGSAAIVTGIACLALGLVGGFLLGRKKRSAAD